MLNVYATLWCPHSTHTMDFLKKHNIRFNFINMDEVDGDVEKMIIDVNGGDDWVVPTLEYNGKWRPGKRFNEEELTCDLKEMGISF